LRIFADEKKNLVLRMMEIGLGKTEKSGEQQTYGVTRGHHQRYQSKGGVNEMTTFESMPKRYTLMTNKEKSTIIRITKRK